MIYEDKNEIDMMITEYNLEVETTTTEINEDEDDVLTPTERATLDRIMETL